MYCMRRQLQNTCLELLLTKKGTQKKIHVEAVGKGYLIFVDGVWLTRRGKNIPTGIQKGRGWLFGDMKILYKIIRPGTSRTQNDITRFKTFITGKLQEDINDNIIVEKGVCVESKNEDSDKKEIIQKVIQHLLPCFKKNTFTASIYIAMVLVSIYTCTPAPRVLIHTFHSSKTKSFITFNYI